MRQTIPLTVMPYIPLIASWHSYVMTHGMAKTVQNKDFFLFWRRVYFNFWAL